MEEEEEIRPLNYPDGGASRPISLLETTNNLKSSLKKLSQKAKASHISSDRIHHFRKWKNKNGLLSEEHSESCPEVDFLCFSNSLQSAASHSTVSISHKLPELYWNEEQCQLEMEILKSLKLNPINKRSALNN
ncbi:hypothetical protein SEUBUCD646_0G02480 [Saccharomyces eubayanus]|uniref:Uncharacterized protein n=2 Tax=Saccharomyces TaxID=4930 RepID=A0A6C1E863_SACPS|nr:hypothetical protein GRS66_007612 [Saccharomyces pastorianus]CAI1997948.1 hypothetical protein SEUBUCD650_0G02490 [Saccharomyces eubayanus]CAI2019597.1 hypothetical protein SEUBUCD646_0G02480 [Saccharomyces eubayanus]